MTMATMSYPLACSDSYAAVVADIPPKRPSPTSMAGNRSPRKSSHCSVPDGPGLATPPAVSTSANARCCPDSFARIFSANSLKCLDVARTMSSSETPLPSSAALACGPAARRHANSVCAHAPRSPSNPFLAVAPAATAACSPTLSTPPLTRATNAASESPGNPVCTGFTKSVPALRAPRRARQSSRHQRLPDRGVRPPTPRTRRTSVRRPASRASTSRVRARRPRVVARARAVTAAAVVVVVVVARVVGVVARAHRRASARIASRRPPPFATSPRRDAGDARRRTTRDATTGTTVDARSHGCD